MVQSPKKTDTNYRFHDESYFPNLIWGLQEFARNLKPYLHGIIASANYPTFEEINNKIKLIK